MWQIGWERTLYENGYRYMYGWAPSLFTWNYHNTVIQLYPNTKQKIQQEKKKKHPDKIMWITIISIFPIFCVPLDMLVTCHLWVSDLLSCSFYSEDCKLHQKLFSYVLDSSVLSDTLASGSFIYFDYWLLESSQACFLLVSVDGYWLDLTPDIHVCLTACLSV